MLGVGSRERMVKTPKKVVGLGEKRVRRGVAGVGCSFGLVRGGEGEVVWWGMGEEGVVSGLTFLEFGEEGVEVDFFLGVYVCACVSHFFFPIFFSIRM